VRSFGAVGRSLRSTGSRVGVSQPWVENVQAVGVGDAWGALALTVALAVVPGGAAGGDGGEGWRVGVVGVVFAASGGGSCGAASGFGLTVVARLVGTVGNAVVGVEG
jgi:hypothetical protein